MTDRPTHSRRWEDAGTAEHSTATFTAYQRQSRRTWSRVVVDHAILYQTLGLTNEAGEVTWPGFA